MLHAFALLQLTCTLPLAGLIWTIQLVHYPMFHRLEPDRFGEHVAWHARAITPLVAPLMLGELACSVALLRLGSDPRALLGAALTCVIWISTALWQSPLHSQLARRRDPKAIQHLVRSNWLRTLAWTARALLALSWL